MFVTVLVNHRRKPQNADGQLPAARSYRMHRQWISGASKNHFLISNAEDPAHSISGTVSDRPAPVGWGWRIVATAGGTVHDRTTEDGWRKSSKSSSGNCVEIRKEGDRVFVRDSKDRSGPVLAVDVNAFRGLIADLKDGGPS